MLIQFKHYALNDMNVLRFAFRQLRKAPSVHSYRTDHGRDLSRGDMLVRLDYSTEVVQHTDLCPV